MTFSGCRSPFPAQRCPAAQGSARAAAHRHHPLLPALAGHVEERCIARHGAERQRYQFAGAHAGSVKQFQQGQRAHRIPPVARSLFLCPGKQGLDLGMGQNARQGPAAARPRQGRGGIVAAPALVDQKAEELPQGRAFAGKTRWRKSAPGLAQPAKRCSIGGQQIATRVLCALQVATIGGQRVRRRPALRREHGEERLDRGGQDYPRATASAAIIRASAVRPTRLSAATMG